MGTRWVTSSVVAGIFGVSRRTIERYCKPGHVLFSCTRLTEGRHIRIDLEAARSMRDAMVENATTATEEDGE